MTYQWIGLAGIATTLALGAITIWNLLHEMHGTRNPRYDPCCVGCTLPGRAHRHPWHYRLPEPAPAPPVVVIASLPRREIMRIM